MSHNHINLQQQQSVEEYLQEKKVYNIFEELLKDLIINQPANPLKHLSQLLSEPQSKVIFIIGPPGSNVREQALQLCDYFDFTCVSVGDLLKKEISKKSDLGQQIEISVKKFQMVNDDIVLEIVKNHLDQVKKEKKNVILEGFPKTKAQGLAMQRLGVIPNNFIVMNLPQDRVEELCLEKLNGSDDLYQEIQTEQRQAKALLHAQEYLLNQRQVQEIYKNHHYKVDADNSKDEVLEDMARLLKYGNNSYVPQRSAKILVLGSPGSGRSSVAKNLCEKYGFVYISTCQLLSDQINKKTDVGLVAQDLYLKKEQVPDEIVINLLKERVQKIDCRIQGYVLDGFPKTLVQLQSLENLRITPSSIFVLDMDGYEDISYDRVKTQQPDLKQPAFQKRVQRWKEHLKNVQQAYSHIILKINSNIPAKNVLEKLSFHLENQ